MMKMMRIQINVNKKVIKMNKMNYMIGKKIMGCTASGPIAGKVIETISPQYPGEEISHKVTCIESYEGWLDEGQYVEFDEVNWDLILIEWNKILTAKTNIQNILKLYRNHF